MPQKGQITAQFQCLQHGSYFCSFPIGNDDQLTRQVVNKKHTLTVIVEPIYSKWKQFQSILKVQYVSFIGI